MSRTLPAILLASLLALSMVVFVAPTGGSQAYFGVTDVTVEPSTPAPGETALINIGIKNFENSPNTIEVSDVAIRNAPGVSFREHARIEDVGTLTPGASLTVPMPYRFDRAGLHTLRIHVWVEAGRTTEHVTYPLTVRVREEHPSMQLRDATYVAGATNEFNVTVTNGLDSNVRDVSVRLHGTNIAGDRRAYTAALASGESKDLSFDMKPTESGERALTAELSYTTAGGVRRTVNRSLQFEAEPLETGVALDTERIDGGSAVRTKVTNLGNVPLERLVVTGQIGDRTVERVAVGSVDAGESTAVVLNATDITGSHTMDITASYRQAGRVGSTSASETVAGNPASIELTGIALEVEDGTVHVTGSTSNLGTAPATSVVVRVQSAEGVSPAYPGRTYFVGTVPASDFVSFDVYASVTENATAIPLEVTYLRDGVQQRETVEVPLQGDVVQSSPDPQSSGPGLTVYLIGGLAVVLVAGLIVVAWRNYRAGA